MLTPPVRCREEIRGGQGDRLCGARQRRRRQEAFMTSRPWLIGLAVGVSLLSNTAMRAQGCDARGRVQFVCGVVNPEDLVAVPGSHWVLASGLNGGAIHAVNTETFKPTQMFPSASARQRLDAKTYASCPGPIDAAEKDKFSAHGLNVRAGRNGVHTVYLVHHGFRESIEVFEIDVKPASTAF